MKCSKNKKIEGVYSIFNQHPVQGLCDDPVYCAGCCKIHIPLRAGGEGGPPGQQAGRGRGGYSDQLVRE